MSQAVWTGSINFGLVTIPVKLYPATEPKDVRFHLYDRRTGKRVRYQRVTRDEEAPVFEPETTPDIERAEPSEPWPNRSGQLPSLAGSSVSAQTVDPTDVVKGLDLSADDIVTVSDDELESIAPERSRTIEIEEFVDLAEIDPVFYEKSYHVAPVHGAGAEKPYVLLQRAMQGAEMAGIGRFVLRTKPHLVAIRPLENALALETLFFGDEVRDAQPLTRGLSDITISERELKTAQQLIRALAKKWSPSSHSDTYREELLELLRAKTPATPAPPDETANAPIGDLMAALRASVEAAKRRQSPSKASTSKKAG
jgi:DNA end-binding protein Ku